MANKRMAAKNVNKAANTELVTLLERCIVAFESGQPELALEHADMALAIAPRSAKALHCKASALASLGNNEDAHRSFAAALKLAPDDIEVLLGAIEFLVIDLADDREAAEDAIRLLSRALKLARKRDQLRSELLLFGGMANNQLGESLRALELLDEASVIDPKNYEIALERGVALFQLCRLEEAKKQLEKAAALDKSEPWAHYYLGLIAERLEPSAAKRHFQEAWRKGQGEIHQPVELSAELFDNAVKDALEGLPEKVRTYLTNVTISVEEMPSKDDLESTNPPLSPEIVGLFRGIALTDRSFSDPWSYFPSAIVLYQRNLQRSCRNREELIEQIGITLIHEVGHFLGLSEEDLYKRGLD